MTPVFETGRYRMPEPKIRWAWWLMKRRRKPDPPCAPLIVAAVLSGPGLSFGFSFRRYRHHAHHHTHGVPTTMPRIRLDIALPTERVSGALLAAAAIICVVLMDGVEVGRTAPGDASWEGDAPDGAHSFTAVAIDTDGVQSEASSPVTITVVTPPAIDPPKAPTITNITQI